MHDTKTLETTAPSQAAPKVFTERFRRKRQGQQLAPKLNEETMQGIIKGGSAIVIGNKATENERAKAIDDFVDDISNMEREEIFALAVAFD